jgi:hypothetical protein
MLNNYKVNGYEIKMLTFNLYLKSKPEVYYITLEKKNPLSTRSYTIIEFLSYIKIKNLIIGKEIATHIPQVMLQVPFMSILNPSKNNVIIKITIKLVVDHYYILIK